MSNLLIKRVGLSMVLGMASWQVMAATSDDFVDAATEAGIAEVVPATWHWKRARTPKSRPSPSRW